jgi:hypothetical protein
MGEEDNGAKTTTYVDESTTTKVTESGGSATLFVLFAVLMHRDLSGKLAAGHCQKAPPPTCRQAAT